MTKVRVHRYRRYDIAIDDYRVSTRMATKEHIDRIGAEVIDGTEAEIDSSLLIDGWTNKDFDPKRPIQSAEDQARERAAAEPRTFEDT